MSTDLLGAAHHAEIGGHQVEVHLPVEPPSHENPQPRFAAGIVDHPPAFDDPHTAVEWHHRPPGIPAEPGEPISAVAIVATEVAEGALRPARRGVRNDLTQRLASDLRGAIEPWFDVMADWIETCTGQDLDHLHPLYTAWIEGNGLTQWTDDDVHVDGARVILTTPTVNPAQHWLWAHALSAAAAGLRPPLELRLVRSAHANHLSGLYRAAVLDAATALELTLVRRGATRLMLGAKLSQLVEAEDITEETRATLQAEVAGLRNRVIHEAAEPTGTQSSRAVELVGAFAHDHTLPPKWEEMVSSEADLTDRHAP